MSRGLRKSYHRNRLLRRAAKRDAVPLNLVSMIDVFTTLVFFLLITSTSVQTVRSPRSLELPQSVTHEAPHDAPVLMVTAQNILLQGTPIMTVADAESTPGQVLGPLKAQLLLVPLLPVEGGAPGATTRGEINIMADKDLPFSLMKKIMSTAGESKFARISLSVNHRSMGAVTAP